MSKIDETAHELEIEYEKLDDEDKELVKVFMSFIDETFAAFKKSEGKLIRTLVNGDTAELTGDEFYRYVRTLPVKTYISIFRKMYADMKKYHPCDLETISRHE